MSLQPQSLTNERRYAMRPVVSFAAEIEALDPSAFPPAPCDEAYRFIWRRSFHPWVSVGVVRVGERISMANRARAKELS